ncbi:YaaA family protein [Nitratifractor sp.]
MKILLAPSESKKAGGSGSFDPCALLFTELCPLRRELLDRYRQIIQSGDKGAIDALFGLKKAEEIERYLHSDPVGAPVLKAIERYVGVAFDHLDYASLDPRAREYVEANVVIFSNLFGPILAGDPIPDYRLKQGAPLGEIRTEKRYREEATPLLEAFLEGEEILDLRAGYYDKFYRPSRPYTTLKFLKDGKVVSHWAKAYRGTVLRHLALAGVESLEAFLALPIPGLELSEIRETKNRRELIYVIDEAFL